MWRALCVLCLGVCSAAAQELPPNARLYAPILREELEAHWPDAPMRSVFAAQVEQETCNSLRSKGCWSPSAELKTSREYGFGLGQITITDKFNGFTEAGDFDPSLRGWKWEDRYDPRLQLRALVVKNRHNFARLKTTATVFDRLAFMDAAYNGGLGGVLSDIKVCRATPQCNPGVWFGNVERTSLKAKTKVKGYGQSFYGVNRTHVLNVLNVRRYKYIQVMEE